MYHRPLALAVSITLTACAGFPEYQTEKPLPELPGIGKTVNESGLEPEADAWPESAWWQVFNDPDLSQLIEQALAENPGIQQVAARVDQALALADFEGARLYPSITSNVSVTAQRFSDNSVQARFAGEHFRLALLNPLQLNYHLDLWGEDRATINAAMGEAQAAQAELADAKVQLAGRMAVLYYQWRALAAEQRIAQRIAECQKALWQLNAEQYQLGLISQPPVLAAESAWHQSRQSVSKLDAEQKLRLHQLAALTGQGPDAPLKLAEAPLTVPAISLPDDIRLSLLNHRADILAARKRVEAAAERIDVAKAGFYPDINIASFAGLQSVSFSDVLFQGASLAYSVGPSISFPIFLGGQLEARLNHQQAAYQQARQVYQQRLLDAVQDIADALSQWRDLDLRLNEQGQQIALAKQNLQLAEQRFYLGLTDKTEILRQQTALAQQWQNQLTLIQQSYQTAIELITALGGGYFLNPPS